MASHPWDIYAKQMFHHGYGYPLWFPEPAQGTTSVQIGDVGWLVDGAFHPLFDTLDGYGHPQPRGHVPVDYVPLERKDTVIDGPREKISQSVLYGRGIRHVDVGASVATGGASTVVPSASLSFRFECKDDYGAILMLAPSGVSHDIMSRSLISRYMRRHFDHWMEFANGRLGLGLREEELLFVSGTTKTSRWGVAAFHGDYREKFGSITGNIGSLSSVEFSLRVADAQPQSSYYRTGPTRSCSGLTRRMAISEGTETVVETDPDKLDQCIFIHYYKMKRRILLPQVPIQAASRPQDLRRDREDDDSESNWCNDALMSYDPVAAILDYILQSSEAKYAVSSDRDVYRIFPHGIPEDIVSELNRIRPHIYVDRSGVGMLGYSDYPDSALPDNDHESECASVFDSMTDSVTKYDSERLREDSGKEDIECTQPETTTKLRDNEDITEDSPQSSQVHSRPLLRYQCSWADCTRAYRELHRLNEHILSECHGPKRNPDEFPEPRNRDGWGGEDLEEGEQQRDYDMRDAVGNSDPTNIRPFVRVPPRKLDTKLRQSRNVIAADSHHDANTALKDLLQSRGNASSLSWQDKAIGYRNDIEWTSVCKIDGVVVASGSGRQQHLAREAAARDALAIVRQWR